LGEGEAKKKGREGRKRGSPRSWMNLKLSARAAAISLDLTPVFDLDPD